MTKKVLMIFAVLLAWGYSGTAPKAPSFINRHHLDHLYDRVKLADGDSAAIVYIYCEYPDYKPVEAQGEGVACVDDMARAAIVYLRYGQYFKDTPALARSRELIRTLLKFQAPNGCFYNFLRNDGQIEKQIRNSKPVPDWWTWRAFWALAEYALRAPAKDSLLKHQIAQSIERILPHVRHLRAQGWAYESKAGFRLPLFLPYKSGADQASVLLKALVATYQWNGDTTLLPLMKFLATGIETMQIHDVSSLVDGLFLSWQNYWHAYGNSQADALLDYFSVSKDSSALSAALNEIDAFYTNLIKEGYWHAVTLQKTQNGVQILEQKRFEQIAYDFRPMIWACLNAFRLTGEEKYARRAAVLANWFLGDNPARTVMYHAENGRCFDGIIGPNKVNLNSGAESTIEALLSLMEVWRNPISRSMLKRR